MFVAIYKGYGIFNYYPGNRVDYKIIDFSDAGFQSRKNVPLLNIAITVSSAIP